MTKYIEIKSIASTGEYNYVAYPLNDIYVSDNHQNGGRCYYVNSVSRSTYWQVEKGEYERIKALLLEEVGEEPSCVL